MDTNFNNIHLTLLVFLLGTLLSFSQRNIKKDTLKTVAKDELILAKDSMATDSIAKPKDILEAIIKRNAVDYEINDYIKNTATLVNKAEIHYKEIILKAGIINIDYKNNLVFAKGIVDSIGEYTQLPEFKQGSQESNQDSLLYNFKTEKAVIWGLHTEQQGVIITGVQSKKVNDSTHYIKRARFTTSPKKKPDYYIQTNKVKIVPGKKVIAGLSNLVIADVPTPLFLPFAYFPITHGRASGILFPTWGQNSNQGYFLQNGGYYFSVNDYFDLALIGDIYTNGSWGFRAETNYAKRYRFTGNLSMRFENLINSERGFPDYSRASNFNIRWTHTQDSHASPNSRFSASVNFGSSQFFRQSLNELSTPLFLTNTFNSSISYSKKFVGTPFNMTSSITLAQNTNTKIIDMSFPSLQVSMDRVYPFAPKNGPKKNPLQKMGLTYNLRADYRISTNDENFFKKAMFDNARSGVQHNLSASTNLKLLKYFTVSPNASLKEVWYFDRINKRYDDTLNEVVTDTLSGFNSFKDYRASLSVSTTVYGTYNFKKGRLKAIRHVIRPSISFGYKPDFSYYYENFQASADPTDIQEYNPFQNGIYGSPSRGLSESIGISINSSIEAKVMPKDSLDGKPKKITLLNNLNFSTNYNMAADSLKWSPVSMNAGTQILNKKLNINLNATLDPYAIDANGNRFNKFNINNGGGLFRLTNANMSMSYAISSDFLSKDKPKTKAKSQQNDSFFGKDINSSDGKDDGDNTKKVEKKTAKIYAATIPWKFSLRYALNYSNSRGQKEITSQSIQLTGNMELTPKFTVGISSGYDFKNKGITYTQLRFARDLDSWKLSFNWVPIGNRSTYYFYIGVKSSVFSDLKWDKRKVPDRRLF
ncbi:MAG: LPS-assembly protein LptD [Flavobacteriaceae bacterium]|nr:LPS-assembly protein LptD [Flavobacteriaceae bacterium]